MEAKNSNTDQARISDRLETLEISTHLPITIDTHHLTTVAEI